MTPQENPGVRVRTGPPSLFDRLVVPLSRPRVLVPLSLFLLLLPVALVFVEGVLEPFLAGLWRELLVQPVILIYVLVVSLPLRRAREQVIAGLRPIVQLTDEEFDQLVAAGSRVNPRGEVVAILVGAVISSILMGLGGSDLEWPLVRVYQMVSTVALFSVMTWILYAVMASPRLTRTLLRQPLQVDILDIRPFEPVGRESLMLSLVFILGATIGIAFSLTEQLVITPVSLVVYAFFAAVTVLVFFANMYDTYRVLSNVKTQELNLAQEHISRAYQGIKEKAQRGEDIGDCVAEMNAWVACKERLGQARTWPRSTEIIGKLLVSALMPAGIAAARQVGMTLLNMIEWPW